MTKKIIIAKTGFNALTETDPNNLIFSSDYNTLKYYLSGSVELSVDGADASTSITHNLGFVPFFVVYVNTLSPVGTWSMVPQTFNDLGAYLYMFAYADTTKIYFQIETASAVNTMTFYYKIFKNNLGL
jgi:hypothetical protein